MTQRMTLSVALNLLAIVVPMCLLYVLFGTTTSAASHGREAIEQLVALACASAICVSFGLASARVLSSTQTSAVDVLVQTLHELGAQSEHRRQEAEQTGRTSN